MTPTISRKPVTDEYFRSFEGQPLRANCDA